MLGPQCFTIFLLLILIVAIVGANQAKAYEPRIENCSSLRSIDQSRIILSSHHTSVVSLGRNTTILYSHVLCA